MGKEYETTTRERIYGTSFSHNGCEDHQDQQLATLPEQVDREAIREELRQRALATPLALLEPVYADLTKLTTEQVRYLGQTNRDVVSTTIKTTIEIPVK